MGKEDKNTGQTFAAKPAETVTTDAEIERRLKYLELQEKEEAFALKQEKKRIELAHRKANALNEENKRRNMEAAQRGCDHRKKNGETYLAGQRDHAGHLHLICQGCMKHFFGPEVPMHLRPDPDRVGGPEVTAAPYERVKEFYQETAMPQVSNQGLEVPAAVAAMGE